MAFGHMMRVTTDSGLQLELAPLRLEDMQYYIADGGMQAHSVTRYLNSLPAQTQKDEEEWFERTRTSKTVLAWGIYDITDGDKVIIGGTTLMDIESGVIRQATSGILIFRKDYWGKGVATAAHLARTRYAFEQMGLHRIRSAVIHGNDASYRALHRIGYETVYVERNTVFVDGQLRHQQNLELLNPENPFWSTWWGNDTPTARARAARQRTRDALATAQHRVTMV